MTKLKNWIGLCALLLSLQANGNEINIQDVWIRTLASGQEDAVVGMVINSNKQARITAAISPAYKFVAMQGPGKSGANKTQELEFINLPAQTPVMLSADGTYLLLSGNKQTLAATDKVPVIITLRFDDGDRKTITVMAQPVNNKGEPVLPPSSNVVSPAGTAASRPAVDAVEARADAPPPQPAPAKAKTSAIAAAPKKPAEAKPPKTVPVAVPKAAPAPVAASVVAAPLPAPVVIASPVVEPQKVPAAKTAEQPRKDETTNADCFNLALELRECEKANDMMQEWCVTNAKSKSSCQLPTDQVKKLRK